ncbi:calcium-permeable channel component Mid1 isoform X2 [Andrena cerasifolii]|uniref:calcium-permeable channel component Mid1 isoform X2 n=1 Tax=Andrena cerasifolii TaxID=2819439 RepID=UPI0040381957
MRLEPPGFTGPPTSNDQSNRNDDRSSSRFPFGLLRRGRLASRVPFQLFPNSQKLQEQWSGESSPPPPPPPPPPRHYWPHHRDYADVPTTTTAIAKSACYWFDSVQEGPETRNATAFHFSYSSVSRSEVRTCVHRALPNISGRRRRVSRSRRCNHQDAQHGTDGGAEDGSTGGRVRLSDHFSSASRPTRSGSEKAGARAREPVDPSRILKADAADALSVDAFAHTAYSQRVESEDRRDTRDQKSAEKPGIRRGPEEIASVRGDEVPWLAGGSKDPPEFWGGCCRGSRRKKSASGRRASDYTARFQQPITNGSRCYDERLAIAGPAKVSNSHGRKYGLLFILYLLSWPLVCSTNPSGQFPTDVAQSPSLGLAENLSQQNATQVSSLLSLSPSIAKQQQQQHRRQTERQRRAREQYVEYGAHERNGDRRGRREMQQEQRAERGAEESSSYEGHLAVLEYETAVHPYNEYSWEVNQINPWLSACDLAGPAPADLQGSCGPPEVPKNCPAACVAASGRSPSGSEASAMAVDADVEFLEVIGKVKVTERSPWSPKEKLVQQTASGRDDASGKKEGGVRMAPEQCLFYLEESHKRDICRDDFGRTSTRSFLTPRENRYWFMSGLRLRHCCEHAVVNALAPGKGGPLENVLNGGEECADALDKLLLVDALAARLHCEFEEVLARYDCGQPYSVIFNCTHCKEAYRKWVCSSLVPYFAHGGPQDLDTSETSWAGSRLRPCRSFCQSVEQRCPYLLPGDRAPAYPTQYAGEPTFLCRDPKIPETGEQATRALQSSEEGECCFHACSEERPGSGICANCTDREPRKRGRSYDPPTAPHCEINPIQPAPTGEQYGLAGSTESSLDEGEEDDSSPTSMSASATSVVQQQQQQQQQRASLCGSGAVGPVPSVSSSDRSSASTVAQLVWLCSILASLFGDGGGNVRATRVLWMWKLSVGLFAVLSAPAEGTGRAGELVGWLHRCSGGHGANWMLGKWVMAERRCRRGWWCWWRWRWRRISASGRVRWKLRPRRARGESPGLLAAVRDNETLFCPTNKFRDSFRGCWSSRVCRWTRNFGSFAMKCRWRWWWWWLYRWRRSRGAETTRRGRSDAALILESGPRGKRDRARALRRRGRRIRRQKGIDKGDLGAFEEDFWHSPARRRYLRLSSRKDPP